MPLVPGTRIGHYDMTAKLGEGGMGVVYRAKDTKLGREVALKILPEAFAGDPDRLARFQREAQVLASLNHPNIAQIHGLEEADGIKALVLELVEGPTLADRIAQGAIPLDEALPIARQIAEALEAAHEAGVIHRDLKPANVKVKADGTVKVLDFGLAKALEPAQSEADIANSPTLTAHATQMGVILGTAAYMAPEQARGKPVDKRADIWAFGCVLYEMLTGRRAFEAEDVSLTLAEVMKSEPAWERLPDGVSPALQTYLRRCLQKDPRQRVRDIGDVRLALEGAFESAVPAGGVGAMALAPPVGWRRALPLAGTLVGGSLVTGLVVWSLTRPAPRPPPLVERFVVTTPATELLAGAGDTRDVAIAPDGTFVVYRASAGGEDRLYVRPVNQLEGHVVFSTPATVRSPVVSPDGAWIAFNTNVDYTWKKVSPLGGQALTLFPTMTPGLARGASWLPDDTIIVAHTDTGLSRGPAAGGELEALTTPDADRGERGHAWPEVLPGGQAVLFTIVRGAAAENMDLAVLDLATMEQKVILPGGSHALYSPTGHLIYGVDGTLLAVPFDVERLEVTGPPAPVLEGVVTRETGAVQFSLSADGSLVYISGDASGEQLRTLVWVDREGQEEPIPAPARQYTLPHLSPDGTRIALDVRGQDSSIWIWDLVRQGLTRLAVDSTAAYPVWTPDSQRLVFSGRSEGQLNIFWKAADGAGSTERLTQSANAQFPYSISPDGESLVFRENRPGTGEDLLVLSLTGDRSVEPLVVTAADERIGEVSPDGRWIAYQSNQSGRLEVYVRPFSDAGAGQWQVSTDGGAHPLWAADGRELFYRSGSAAMAVPVGTTPSFTPGAPTVLFEDHYLFVGGLSGRGWDVTRDGQRFLMIKEASAAEGAAASTLILVRNWIEELTRLVPN